jgi:hypothetical protein
MLTPDLVWVAEDEGRILGVLIAMAGHGFFMPLRVATAKSAPNWCLRTLLKKAFRDAVRRGFMFYLVQIGGETFQQFARILKRRGALLHEAGWAGGHIPTLLREKPRIRLVDAVKLGKNKNVAC